ncbi:MAG: hypothetical protein ABIM46_05360 [candidate division WOR-3 bacterium]
MDTLEKVREGVRLLEEGLVVEAEDYIRSMRTNDPLAASLVEVYLALRRHNPSEVIRLGSRLSKNVSEKPELGGMFFIWMGSAYRLMGEPDTAENYFLRAIDFSEHTGQLDLASVARTEIFFLMFSKGEYVPLYRRVKDFLRTKGHGGRILALYLLSTLEIIRGEPTKALDIIDSLLESGETGRFRLSLLELRGLALRLAGGLEGAVENFLESAKGYAEMDGAYSVFPVAKALEITRLASLKSPPASLLSKCAELGKGGGWGEQAAVKEIEALVSPEDDIAAQGLYQASLDYFRVYQPLEAFVSGLSSAFLAWRCESPVFSRAARFIAPLAPLHPGFASDPLLGEFLSSLSPLLCYQVKPTSDRGIRAHLAGEFLVSVDGRRLSLTGWRNDKALMILVYLLLSPKHRMAWDHLLFLLWPKERDRKKAKNRLHVAVSILRKHLARPGVLSRKRDFYQLEEVWTDLGEIENLLRLADATHDPAEKEELLARARELAKGELLPEFPYDRYIDEYRQYYERLRKRLFGS